MGTPRPSKRRRGRALWIVGGALLMLVVIAAVVLPFLLDVERHRGRIEAALREATGWDAELGRIELSVLHGLVLTVSPVTLSAPDGGSRFEAGRIGVVARWGPLFHGRLEIDSVELLRPEITLVRPDAVTGWVLPLPPGGPAAQEAQGPATAGASPAVSIARIDVREGALRIEDRSVEPTLSLVVGNVDVELHPATGVIRGAGEISGEAGRVSWSGSPQGDLELTLEGVKTDPFGPWLGENVLHPGGRLDGTIALDPSAEIRGELTGESLRVLAGSRPLPRTELAFALTRAETGWRADRVTLDAGGAQVVATGSLLPLALEIELEPTPLETALELTEAILPLGLDVSPPGSARLEARVDLSGEGTLSYEARGELSAARFVAAQILPEATDVRTAFRLTRQGELILRILDGKVGGGPLAGEVRIDSIEPLGTLTFDGTLDGASIGALLGGFVARAPERLTGPAAVRGKVAVDLGAATLDASALRGRLALGAEEIALSGWDLESAFRESLRDKLGKLADVAALVDPDARKALAGDADEAAEPVSRLLDHLAAEIRFDALPWTLSPFELRSGGITARGQGSFDPLGGTLDLRCAAELDPRTTGRYVERYPQLRSLVNAEGRLSLPLRFEGPLMSPSVGVELSQLVPRTDEPEDAVRGLIRGLIDKKLSKKR